MLDFQENEISPSSQGPDDNENLEIGSFEEHEINKFNKSDYCSQEVSSCDSNIGQEPQPVTSIRPESLSASVLLATFAEEEAEDEQLNMSDSLLDSAKKRKHVRFGLAEQMAKLIQRKKSQETLEKYQNKQQGKKENEEEFEILEVKNIGNIHLVYGERDVLAISSRFCSRTPRRGDVVRFSSSKALSLIGERKIWFGVTSIAFSKVATSTADLVQESDLTQERSLKCPCRDEASSACLSVSTVFQLAMLKYRADSEENPLDGSYGESQEDGGQSQGEEKKTIAHTVEILRDSSSSSSLSQSADVKLQLEVLVQRVFFQSKEADSESYQVSLLCEDMRGDFCVLKLSPELKEDEHWAVLFSRDWEYFQGGRVTLTSPFLKEGRSTRSKNSRLFDVIRSVRETNQRICYVLTCCPGSQYVMEDPLTVKPQLSDLSAIERRYNCEVTALYFDTEDRVLHVFPDGEKNPVRVEVRRSHHIAMMLPSSERFPLRCTLLGVSHDNSVLSLDCFSSIVSKSPVQFDLSKLPLHQADSEPGTVVRVEGPVAGVDLEASMQWLQCSVCQSEELEETEQGWRCESCGSEKSPIRMFELVCDVGEVGARVRLTSQAQTILAPPAGSDDGRGFNPADVLGQSVPSILCLVGTDSVAREC